MTTKRSFATRRRHLIAAAAAVVVAVAAVGGVALATAPSATTPAAPDDPNKAAERDFYARYLAWLDSPAAQDLDVRALPKRNIAASYLGGEPTFDAAVAKADVVALGRVTEYKFGSWGASATLQVENPLKGEALAGGTLTVSLAGGPFPDESFTTAVLAEAEAAPALLPGDRAVLLLQRSPDGRGFDVQPFSGHYRLDPSDRVRALPGNAFGREVEGMNVGDFTREVRQRVGPR